MFLVRISIAFLGKVVVLTTVTIAFTVNLFAAVQTDRNAPTVYTWQPKVTGDWQSPSNWEPARIVPAPDDILVFNTGTTTTVTNVPTQTIGQLFVSGGTNLNLQASAAVIVTVGGGDGDDFQVTFDSAINFNSTNAITASLVSGVTGAINGSMAFSSQGATDHRLIAADAGAVTFGNGSVFTAGEGFTGNPFGIANLNSIIFESGSTCVSIAGGNPFGATEPASVVVFKTGSLFSLRGPSETSFSGRTYANMEVNYAGGAFALGSSPLVMDDLTILSGRLSLEVTGTGHSIRGDITVSPGAGLGMQGPFPGHTISLNGDRPQTITILGQVGVTPANTIAIDNPLGVTVNTFFLAWNVELINGVVDATNPLGYFNVIGTATRVNGYIDGYLRREMYSIGTYDFYVGTKNGYSPMTMEVTGGHDFPLAAKVKAVQSAQPNIFDSSKALSRYWEIFAASNLTEANLTFNYLDPDDIPIAATETNFVIQRYKNGFTQPAGIVDTQANIFRVTGLTDLSVADWTLAEPGAVVTPTATNTPTSTPTNTPTSTPTSTPAFRTAFDYDGDHKTDISVFRPTDGAWYLQQSQAGLFGMLFGFGSDKIAPADYDGDGKTDIAVYRPSTGIWYVLKSTDGTVEYFVFGLAEDLPTPADYDGDGKADVSVYRPSTGTWYRQDSSDGSFHGIQFGATEDKPTIGDWDGDGRSDIAVFRPSTGAWYRINSGNGSIYGELFGFGTDVIAPADYDGDGKTDLAAYRPTDGIWYLKYSSNSSYDYKVFGLANDIPAPGDFDGDGKADVSVFRPSDGTWYRQNSSNDAYVAFQFGANGDKPTMAAFQY